MLVFLGGYRDFRGPTKGNRGRLDGSVEKSPSTDMETESFEFNAISRPLQFADRGASLSLS